MSHSSVERGSEWNERARVGGLCRKAGDNRALSVLKGLPMRRWMLPAVVVPSALAVACTSDDDVRSGTGPTAQESSTTEVAGQAEATTSETAAVAEPSTSPALLVVGSVEVPEGDSGMLSVALVGPLDTGPTADGTLPVVVRNRTDSVVYGIEASAVARAADGSLAGTGDSQGFAPTMVRPGEWAFGYVYFSAAVPADATFEVTASGDSDPGFIGSLDVQPVETNLVPSEFTGQQIVGIVANEHNQDVFGPVSVDVACFDAAGTAVTSTHRSFTDSDTIPIGGTASFTIDLFEVDCPNYVVGANGYTD